MKTAWMALVTVLLLPAAVTRADIYKWTDAGGHVHFGDKVPAAQRAEPVTVRVNSYTHVTYDLPPPDAAPAEGGQVILYGTSWCTYCRQARLYFQANHIAFADRDIEASAEARREYDALHARGVPVILVGNKRMNGFSPEGFRAIYP
jgi:glutaredoxin